MRKSLNAAELCLEWLISAGGFEGRALSQCQPPRPRQVSPALSTYLQETARASESAGRCRESAVTHAWAAGQLWPWGRPPRGCSPGSVAGLGGHRSLEWWEEKVLEGLPGSWLGALSLECPSVGPNTPRFCPDSGSKNVHHSPNERDGRREGGARCHPRVP